MTDLLLGQGGEPAFELIDSGSGSGREQRGRAVAHVVMGASFGDAGGQWQNGLSTIQYRLQCAGNHGSTLASSIVRGAPGRGVATRLYRRCSAGNRLRHFKTVCDVTRSSAATSLFSLPSARENTTCERMSNATPSCADAPRLPAAHAPLRSAPFAISVCRPALPPDVERTISRSCDWHFCSTNLHSGCQASSAPCLGCCRSASERPCRGKMSPLAKRLSSVALEERLVSKASCHRECA